MELYVTNNCGACRTAELFIAQWRAAGQLAQEVEVKPLPTDPNFESYVRSHTGGRFGTPLLVNTRTNTVIIGFASHRYRELLCQPT